MNTFSIYIPNKLITVDDKDPPWMDELLRIKLCLESMHVNFLMLIRRSTMPT